MKAAYHKAAFTRLRQASDGPAGGRTLRLERLVLAVTCTVLGRTNVWGP